MLLIYAWLFFLFGTYVVAVPVRGDGQNVVIHQGGAADVAPPTHEWRPQRYVPYAPYKGYWVLKNPPPNHVYSDRILRIKNGEFRLYYVESGGNGQPVIRHSQTLSSREEKAHLVGVYTQIPTLASTDSRDRFKELVINLDEHREDGITVQRYLTETSREPQMPNPYHGSRVVQHNEENGYWVLGDATADIPEMWWYQILHINNGVHTSFRLTADFEVLGEPRQARALPGHYFRIPFRGMQAPRFQILSIMQAGPAQIYDQAAANQQAQH